ncbi:hypothetical protein D3C72_1653160 [compost metagenome]
MLAGFFHVTAFIAIEPCAGCLELLAHRRRADDRMSLQPAQFMRCGMPGEVRRRCAHDPVDFSDLGSDHRIRRRGDDAQRHLDVLGHQVVHAVVEHHVERDVGIALLEQHQQRRQQ